MSLHYKQFVCNSVGLCVVQHAPGILGITRHGLTETAPEILRGLKSCGRRRGREVTVLRIDSCSGITLRLKLLLVFVHGVRTFGTKELQRVIAKHIGVGQDLVISQVLLVLINSEVGITTNHISGFVSPCDRAVQHSFQVEGVLVQNSRSFHPERAQDLTSLVA